MSTSLRLLQISDPHLRASPGYRLWESDVDAGLTAVIDRALAHHGQPDLVVVTGDLVHDEGIAAYRRLATLLEVFDAPVQMLPGNHDDPAALRAALPHGRVRCDGALAIGGWRLLFLDSSVAGSPAGHLAATELERVERALVEAEPTPLLAFVHHPPLAIGSAWLDTMQIDNGDALLALAAAHPHLRAIAFGHIHQQWEARRDGLQLLGCPSTCAQFLPGAATPLPDPIGPGYRWFELRADGSLSSHVGRLRPG